MRWEKKENLKIKKVKNIIKEVKKKMKNAKKNNKGAKNIENKMKKRKKILHCPMLTMSPNITVFSITVSEFP